MVKELDKNGIGKVDPDEVPVKGKTRTQFLGVIIS